jgi:hypothetical protein
MSHHRSATAEHVGVEDDHTHARSLHSSTTASAARSHVNDRARARPAGPSSSRREDGLVDARRDGGDRQWIDEDGRTAATSSMAVPCDVTTGVPHAIASRTGEPEALVERGVHHAQRASIERRELGVGDPPDPAVDVDVAPPASADHAQRDSGLAAASTARARFFRGSSVATART